MKLSMRIATVPAAILMIAGVPGCSSDLACEGGWCGTLVVVSGAEPSGLLPPLAQFDTHIALADLVFWKLADAGTGATSLGEEGFEPRIARSWAYSDDSLSITFHLDPGASWHDGTRVTAADVAFTHDMYTDPQVNALARGRVSKIVSVRMDDSLTVTFNFDNRYPEQFFDAVYHMRILPKHLLEDVPRSQLASHAFVRNPVGNGPFRFVRWEAGESVELEGDSSFFARRPGLRRIIWRFSDDPLVMVAQLSAGEADLLNPIPGAENIARIEKIPELRTIAYPSGAYAYVGFNFNHPEDSSRPHPLFGSRELRRALTMAVDREAVARAALGEYGAVPNGPVTRGLWIWQDDIEQIPYNAAGAASVLDDLGWRDSNGDGIRDRGERPLEFELLVPATSLGRKRAAVVIQSQLHAVGIDMRIAELEPSTMGSRMQNRRFDAYFGAWLQDPSPGSIEETWASSAIGGPNYGAYSNTTFDSLAHEALNSFNPDSARAIWKQALGVINGDAPAIWIYDAVSVAGIHERFENVSMSSAEWWSRIWTWRVPPSQLIDRDLATPR